LLAHADPRRLLLFGVLIALSTGVLNVPDALGRGGPPVVWFHPMYARVGDLHAVGTYVAEDYPQLVVPAVIRLRGLGVDWIREEFRADHLHDGAKRPYDFYRYDNVIRRERAAGINILGLLDYNDTFNHLDHVWMAHDHMVKLTNDFVRFVTAVVTHYKNVIRYWQIWNEPDIAQRWRPYPSAVDYAYLLRRSYTAIKNVDPRDKVVVAGPTTGNDPQAVQFVLAVHHNDGRFDVAAFQPYAFRPSTQDMVDVAQLKRLHKPVWFSEIGWGGLSGCRACGSPYDQANLLSAVFLIAAVSGVEHCFWFEFRDDSTLPTYPNHFGLVQYDFRGKPAYRSFGIGKYLMDGSTVTGVARLNAYVRLYRFRRGTRTFYEMWNETGIPEWVYARWPYKFVDIDSSTFSHRTASYGNRLNLVMPAYAVEYLLPPELKLRWHVSLPVRLISKRSVVRDAAR
jgi:hypothetical protein